MRGSLLYGDRRVADVNVKSRISRWRRARELRSNSLRRRAVCPGWRQGEVATLSVG